MNPNALASTPLPQLNEFLTNISPQELEQALWDMFMRTIEAEPDVEELKTAAHLYRSITRHFQQLQPLH